MGGYEHLMQLLKRQEKRKEIGIPLNATLLISVGELSVRKNHRVVVEVLQQLPNNYWYVIVGKGDLKGDLKSLDSTGRLRLLGFRTDIVELLHCSDLFVFPSLQEGLPVALMEAMASGLPCVASRIRGNTDLIGDDGHLFDTQDISGCKMAITQILENSISKESTHHTHIIRQYGIDKIKKKMIDIYTLK